MDENVKDNNKEDAQLSQMHQRSKFITAKNRPFERIINLSFTTDERVSQAYNTSEKLTVAIFFVTDHISDSNPLKSSIRDKANILLDTVMSIGGRGENMQRAVQTLRRIVSSLEVMKFMGAVSYTNVSVLVRAADHLGALFKDILDARSQSLHLTDQFFAPIPPTASIRRKTGPVSASPKEEGSVFHNVKSPETKVLRPPRGLMRTYRERQSTSHSDGRGRIVEFLKAGPRTIRDVAAHLPEVGVKTVQRELAALVKEGTVLADGEKRWRTYALSGSGSAHTL